MDINLSPTLSHQLKLTPQLQQAIYLLQISTLDLHQELEKLINDNPLLEKEDFTEETEEDISGSQENEESVDIVQEADEISITEIDSMAWQDMPAIHEDEDIQEPAYIKTLSDWLIDQINLMPLSQQERNIVLLLTRYLDETGYLEVSLEEIHETIKLESNNISLFELEIALKYLQSLEPPGVGARSLSECLELQLKCLPLDTPGRTLAISIASRHLPLLAKKSFVDLRRRLECDEESLRIAIKLITQLNPKPGLRFSPSSAYYIGIDVLVRKEGNHWVAKLNRELMPALRVNQMYANILKEKHHDLLLNKLQEAKWFIRSIQQRAQTILRVSQAIVDRQIDFFEEGKIAMQPLTLKEIADELTLHPSTISRVTTQKYMLTPQGVLELKDFFDHVATQKSLKTSTAVRMIMKNIFENEDGSHPISDHSLAVLLEKQGIMIARRTVTKYREAMRIQPAHLRKSL